MSGNANFGFEDVAVISVAACEAPEVVTSAEIDERLAPFYERTGARPGLLKSLAGVEERRRWPEGVSFMEAAAKAGEAAIERAGIDRERIGVMIDSSVCRERLEPSSAVTVHHFLGLPSTCINLDLSNACLGFVNAMHMAGTMIEAGQIDYALIVDGEGTREIHDNTIAALNAPGTTLDDLFDNFASLTLGSGSAGMVLGRHSENPGSHRVVRGFFRAATEHHELCIGSLDGMSTDAKALLDAGTELAKRAWDEADTTGWPEADRFVLHQVSKVHTGAMIDTLGLAPDRVPMTFPKFGNIGPAAIPFTLAKEQDSLEAGDVVLCMGAGSGINASIIELRW
ncbi:MAG: 3-oxoacyl-ACP synthase III [Actinomycetota bacterium]